MATLDFDEIRKLVIIALFSDDYLLNKLVLKGGNALNLIYKINERSSIDIDVSIENDFKLNELEMVKNKIKKNLEDTFIRKGIVIFDFVFEKRPTSLVKN